jgi:hypothetical protein
MLPLMLLLVAAVLVCLTLVYDFIATAAACTSAAVVLLAHTLGGIPNWGRILARRGARFECRRSCAHAQRFILFETSRHAVVCARGAAGALVFLSATVNGTASACRHALLTNADVQSPRVHVALLGVLVCIACGVGRGSLLWHRRAACSRGGVLRKRSR